MSISMTDAERVLRAAVDKARGIGVPMNIAVLDAAAHLKAFVRMDGALLGSIDIAIRKSRTAALFGLNTETLFEYCKPGGPSYGLENTNGGLVVFAGGVPLHTLDGATIGAVGVSGGAPDEDFIVARAAAGAIGSSPADAST